MQIVGIGSDGASLLTGRISGVITRLKHTRPYALQHHCGAHKVALASAALSNIPAVVKVEKVWAQSVTGYLNSEKLQMACSIVLAILAY